MRNVFWRVIAVSFVSLGLLVLGSTAMAEDAQKWKSRAEASYVLTDGNTETQSLAGKLETSFDDSPNRYFLKGAVLFAENDGDKTSERYYVDGRYERAFTERFFGWFTASYLRDKFAGYDSQTKVGPGVGYEFIKREDVTLKGLAGVIYTFDNYVVGGDDDYASGKAALDFMWQIMENLRFKQYVEYLHSFEDSDIYFINSESALEVKVSDNVSLGLGYIVNYQHEAPAGAKKTDTRFLTSLVVDF